MKSLILAEKPSVARDMAKVLGCNKTTKNYIEGKDYIITWALGHLATLFEPGDYDNKYKTWDMNHLPMLPEKLKVKRLKKTSHQLKTFTYLSKRKDVKDIIIATDAGREGELVARWAILLSGTKKPLKRLWISSQTTKAIKDGMKNLKDGGEYFNLYMSAVARAEADWLVGLNVTRALTCKFNTNLSAGRVQTPTLAMIVNRENEIKNFKPVTYNQIKIDFGNYFGHWRNKKGSSRIFDTDYLNRLKEKLEKNRSGKIVKLERKEKKEYSPLLYDLTELQREANKRFSFSAKKTLSVLQALYERYKIVTYPRTDSRYITSDMEGTLKARLEAISGGKYKNHVKEILSNKIIAKRMINNSKVTDHHALIPTEEKPNLDKLSFDERRIYNLIVKRFLACLMKPALYNTVNVETLIAGEHFFTKGKELKEEGWKKIESETKEVNFNKEVLPEQNIKLNEKVNSEIELKKVIVESAKTTPPSRFTEASLLSAMEKPNKFMEDSSLKGDFGGLGTPATRAEIIEKLISSFYVERRGNSLIPTSKGKQLIDLVPVSLKSPELTAKWEKRLEAIAKGKDKKNHFMKDIRQNAIELVESVKKDESDFKLDNITKHSCPMCGKKMLSVKGKKNKKMLVCQDRTCGYREEEKDKNSFGISMSKRDRHMNKRLASKYSDKEEAVTNLGDLLKGFMD